MKKYKKQLLIILSFLIPLITYLIVFYIKGLLTNKTILSGDMAVQYYPLYNYLKGVMDGTNSIFYSFSKGLGGTMFGTMLYYLSSPLNIFLIFIDKQYIPDFMTYLVILKLSLCGLTMYLYMRRKFKTDNILLLAFSLCYAFMGYNLNYFINIMWLDVVFMAPIVMIGLDMIIENKSPILYVISLFISIFSNYYISYMLCIFCTLYFLYSISLKYDIKKEKKIIIKITKKFIIYSLLTGLMCSFFLVPCIFEMISYGRSITSKKILTFDYNFFDLFSKTYIGTLNLNDTLNYSSMNLYTGIITLPLVFLFIMNKDIEKKERFLTLSVILAMILPCFFGILNYVWHLCTIPSFYSFRYSFLLCFFLINIAYKSIMHLQISKTKIFFYLAFYLLISLLLIPITYYGNYYDFLNYKLIWITIAFLISYFVILYCSINNRVKKYILSILILIELVLNIGIILSKHTYADRKILIDEQNYEEILKKYNNNNQYRIQLYNETVENNNSLLKQYRGISTFLSTTNYKAIDFLIKTGKNSKNENRQNYYTAYGQSYIINSLLNTKILEDKEDNYNYNYEKIEQTSKENTSIIYNNKNALSIGYMVENECNNLNFEFPFDEKIFNCIINKNDEYYKKISPLKSSDDKYTYSLDEKGYYYIYSENMEEIEEKIVQKTDEQNIIYYAKDYIILKNETPNYKLMINKIDDINNEKIKIYYFCKKCFEKNLKILEQEQLIYEIHNNKINGNINTKGGILLITLPYERGFEIHIDGKKTDYKMILDTFIGVNLTKGHHTIEINYKQPFLNVGIIISIVSSILCIFFIESDIIRKKSIYSEQKKC